MSKFVKKLWMLGLVLLLAAALAVPALAAEEDTGAPNAQEEVQGEDASGGKGRARLGRARRPARQGGAQT